MDLNSAKPKVGSERPRIENLVDMLKLNPKKWIPLRILPASELNTMIGIRTHWVNIIGGKTKKEVKIPKTCVSYNPADESDYDGVTCPYCELDQQTDVKYLTNVISRSEQDNQPTKLKSTAAEKKSGYKDMDSDSWTPVRVMRCPPSLLAKIQGLKDLNKVKGSKGTTTYGVDHAKFGRDISIKYDPDAKGGDKYQIQLGDKAPLTEEESSFLIFNLSPDLVKQIGVETEKQARAEIKKMEIVGAHDMDDDDEDEDDEDDLGSKKKPKGKAAAKPAPKGKRKPVDDEDDEDEDDDLDEDDDDLDEDDEDEEPPAKSKAKGKPAKPAAKGKAKPKFEDDDEDEDDDLDDDDEDADDDSFDEDEDDEDEEPPVKSKAKGKAPAKPAAKGKSKSKFDDDEDDEDEDLDDDEEEDDEDEPPVKSKSKGKAPAKPAAKGKRKPVVEEDDDEDEDLDDDEEEDDEDDEPPVKSKGKAPAKRRSNF